MKRFAILLGVLLIAGTSYGATNTWTGLGGTGSWTNPANWTANTLPDFDDSDGKVDDIALANVTSLLVMTLDGNKTIRSLILSTARNYTITGDTLFVKSGIINRTSSSGNSTQTIYSAIQFGTNAVISVYGNHSTGSRLNLMGPLSDGGKGFDLLFNGERSLGLYGPIDMSGTLENKGGYNLLLYASNTFSSIVATLGTTLYVLTPCPTATNLIIADCTVQVRTNSYLPRAAIQFMGTGSLVPAGGNWSETHIYTNPVFYTAVTLGVGGTESIVLTSDITLISNSVIYIANARNDVTTTFKGTLRDRSGGSSNLRVVGQGTSRVGRLDGTNTFTGSFTVDTVKLTLNGELATSRITFGAGATITGNCLIHFKNNDWIVLTNSPAVTISSMKFDLTGLTVREQPVVDYPVGTLTKPADSSLSNLLTAASVQQGWSLRNDSVNKQLIASRKSSGSFILIR